MVAHAVQVSTHTAGASSPADVQPSDSVRGILLAHEQRSTTASLVRSLLYVADKQGGASAVGAQVRMIAGARQDSMAATVEAIEETATRGTLQRVLWGDDYESIALLKNEAMKARGHLARLQAILASTTNTTERAILAAQIETLEKQRADMQYFAVAHERTSGLFGWLVRPRAQPGDGNLAKDS